MIIFETLNFQIFFSFTIQMIFLPFECNKWTCGRVVEQYTIVPLILEWTWRMKSTDGNSSSTQGEMKLITCPLLVFWCLLLPPMRIKKKIGRFYLGVYYSHIWKTLNEKWIIIIKKKTNIKHFCFHFICCHHTLLLMFQKGKFFKHTRRNETCNMARARLLVSTVATYLKKK